MSHFGLFCPNTVGHLNPMIAVADALRTRGHRVTFFLLGESPAQVTSAGFEVVSVGGTRFPAEDYRAAMAHLGTLSGRAALKHTVAVGARTATAVLEGGAELAQGMDLDALIIDQVSSPAGTVADELGIPFATICNALLLNSDPLVPPFFTSWQPQPGAWPRLKNRLAWKGFDRMFAPILEQIQARRCKLGLSLLTHVSQTWSSRLQVSQQPEAFDFPRSQAPPALHYVGPLRLSTGYPPVDFPWDRLDGRPLVYASLGTLQNRVSTPYWMIAQACSFPDVQLVITTGRGIAPSTLEGLPGQPIVVSYAPQLELLSKATLAITHAGLNTALDALSVAVPMVAVPVTNEQPGIAARVVWSGAGEALPLRRATVETVRSAVERVLANPSHREAVKRIRASIQAGGGATRAAELIEQHVLGK